MLQPFENTLCQNTASRLNAYQSQMLIIFILEQLMGQSV
jgi:hypothetical protein